MIATIRLFCCVRHALDGLAVGAVVGGLLCIPFGRRLPTRWKRRLGVAWFVMLVAAALRLADTPYQPFERFAMHAKLRWQALLEPNILTRRARFENTNSDIVVPTVSGGFLLTDNRETDLHVELDSAGCLAIACVPLTAEHVRMIASHRRTRIGEFRVFLWVDGAAPPESRSALIRSMRDAGCGSLHWVAASPGDRGSRPQYKAIPCPPDDLAAACGTSDARIPWRRR